jgi:hypothetical protein
LAGSGPVASALPSRTFDDFRWEIDARLVPPSTDGFVFLDFRRQANGDRYTLVLDPDAGAFLLARNVGPNLVKLIDWRKETAINHGTSRNRVGVRAQGNIIQVLINGRFVGQHMDSALKSGQIGIGAGNFRNAATEARFGNLAVTTVN